MSVIKNGERTSGDNEGPASAKQNRNDQKLISPSKSKVIGSFIGLCIVGFCFGIGLMLAVKTVNNLEELIRR